MCFYVITTSLPIKFLAEEKEVGGLFQVAWGFRLTDFGFWNLNISYCQMFTQVTIWFYK